MFNLSINGYDFNANKCLQVTKIDGLCSSKAIINSSSIYNFDGEKYQSSKLDKRNIVIEFTINNDIESNLSVLNYVISCKKMVKLKYNEYEIDGYVESFEYDKFSNPIFCQISIICLNPFFKSDLKSIIVSRINNSFEFPFAIESSGIEVGNIGNVQEYLIDNNGNAECGLTINIDASDTIVNPVIYNNTNNKRIKIIDTIKAGEQFEICTEKGNKYVKKYTKYGEFNGINYMDINSDWIDLNIGNNYLAFDAEAGSNNMIVTFKHFNMFGGV